MPPPEAYNREDDNDNDNDVVVVDNVVVDNVVDNRFRLDRFNDILDTFGDILVQDKIGYW